MQEPEVAVDSAAEETVGCDQEIVTGAQPVAGNGPSEQADESAPQSENEKFLESLKRRLDSAGHGDGSSDASRKSKRNKLLIPSGISEPNFFFNKAC